MTWLLPLKEEAIATNNDLVSKIFFCFTMNSKVVASNNLVA